MLISLFIGSSIALLAPPLFYYLWMKNKAKMPWGLALDSGFEPEVTLIIATFNEASVIAEKLGNVQTLDYHQGKLQVIVVDSASTDGTLDVCKTFLKTSNPRFQTSLLSENERLGKAHALNFALQYAKGEIIATSDADSFWEPDALRKAVSFFADPIVGAVTGREELLNLKKSVHTQSEGMYRKFYYALRIGESKIHSTLIFQGELSLYRRSAFESFEDRPGYSDDIGTIVKMVSNQHRCIFVPEAVFHDTAAFSLRGRLTLKSRRAQHLVAGIIESTSLKIRGKLPLSSAIVAFNFYMHVLSPFLLALALISFVFVLVIGFQVFWFLMLPLCFLLLFNKSRLLTISYLTSNLALTIGLMRHITRRKGTTWRKVEEMRTS